MSNMICKVEGCNRGVDKKGMCEMHYMRQWRTGSIDDSRPLVQCKAEGCTRLTSGVTGLCIPCYKQTWYLKSVGRDRLVERTSKERWVNTKTGYVMVKHERKLTYEHIVLAEKALGKPLPKGAIVHHMNENRADNHTPFNLVVCPSQEYHILLHKRMREIGYENN